MDILEAIKLTRRSLENALQLLDEMASAESLLRKDLTMEAIRDNETRRWVIQEKDDLSKERKEIIVLLLEAGEPMKPALIAKFLNKDPLRIRKLLFRMKRAGQIIFTKQGYLLPYGEE